MDRQNCLFVTKLIFKIRRWWKVSKFIKRLNFLYQVYHPTQTLPNANNQSLHSKLNQIICLVLFLNFSIVFVQIILSNQGHFLKQTKSVSFPIIFINIPDSLPTCQNNLNLFFFLVSYHFVCLNNIKQLWFPYLFSSLSFNWLSPIPRLPVSYLDDDLQSKIVENNSLPDNYESVKVLVEICGFNFCVVLPSHIYIYIYIYIYVMDQVWAQGEAVSCFSKRSKYKRL